MLAALIIVFREVFEAGLIVGIVLAVTRTVPRRNAWIMAGIAAGTLGACVVAGFAGALSQLFAGMGQELFNAGILGVAVVMLIWHNVWMARHGKELAGNMRATGLAVAEGSKSLLALAVVVGVAVLREGSEVVLFLYGIMTTDGGSSQGLAIGGMAGLALGAAVCWSTYKGLLRIPPKPLFKVTTALITLLAAGMAAQAVSFLERANWITSLSTTVWDTGWLLSDHSLFGRLLHALIGHTDQPTAMQLTAYIGVLIMTFALVWLVDSRTLSDRASVKVAPAQKL